MYSTLPRSLKETKLVTNIKVEEDEDVLMARKNLVETKSPAELSAITSLSDIPIPSSIGKLMRPGPKPVASSSDVNSERRR